MSVKITFNIQVLLYQIFYSKYRPFHVYRECAIAQVVLGNWVISKADK
ncbi:hypothetical protein D1BOALGB6SA_3064 [Olavius sp. associated proteobacterium Delta 1]|nr:hypothetical protein D1BOALGB6SA_3064 [Olavius sp. associated proteobacterium Delta 1]